MEKLYYVESVKFFEGNRIFLLQYIPEDIKKWSLVNKDFKWYVRKSIAPSGESVIQEGEYVYASRDERYTIAREEDPRVFQIESRYQNLVNRLLEKRINPLLEDTYGKVSLLCTYHINIGHGNHSLIVFKADNRIKADNSIKADNRIHIWMVDCSDYDCISHRYYRANIDACLNHIKEQFKLVAPIHVDVVMLTHPHYDHYSGIKYYIGKNLIDSKTVFYINLKYRTKSHNYNNLLSKLDELSVQIVEPFSINSNNNIRILYPDKDNFNPRLSPNNVSSVYNICFGVESYFVFPGDLETVGWNLMNVNNCRPHMKKTRYYAVSHHGSINGHLRNATSCCRHVHNIRDCLCPSSIPVLMGRNRAFPGIYSSQVLQDFNGRILYSEQDNLHKSCRFLEIDLISNTYSWY